jgi:hypothetical protein
MDGGEASGIPASRVAGLVRDPCGVGGSRALLFRCRAGTLELVACCITAAHLSRLAASVGLLVATHTQPKLATLYISVKRILVSYLLLPSRSITEMPFRYVGKSSSMKLIDIFFSKKETDKYIGQLCHLDAYLLLTSCVAL